MRGHKARAAASRHRAALVVAHGCGVRGQAEDKAVVEPRVKPPRAGIGPLPLIGVHVDAGARLVIVAAAEGGAADAGLLRVGAAHVVLALPRRDSGAADGLPLGDHAADALALAVHADALLVEGSVAAGLGHAELHAAVLRPARRLLLHGGGVGGGDSLGHLLGLARGAVLGGLGLLASLVLVNLHAAPEPREAGCVLQDPHHRYVSGDERVLGAVAQAGAGVVAGRRAVHLHARARVARGSFAVNRRPAAGMEASIVGEVAGNTRGKAVVAVHCGD